MNHRCESIPPSLYFLMMETLFCLGGLVRMSGLSNQVAVTVEQAPLILVVPRSTTNQVDFSLFSATFEFIFFSGIVG